MPKVKRVTARKDYPKFGITKGDLHYHWVLKTGPTTSREFRQKDPPKRGQLTTSSFLQTVYDAIDNGLREVTKPDDIQTLIDTINEAKDECQEKYDNMPEGLQQGTTGVMLEERIAQCEDFVAVIEQAQSDWEQAISDAGDNPSEGDLNKLREHFFTEVETNEPSWS